MWRERKVGGSFKGVHTIYANPVNFVFVWVPVTGKGGEGSRTFA